MYWQFSYIELICKNLFFIRTKLKHNCFNQYITYIIVKANAKKLQEIFAFT